MSKTNPFGRNKIDRKTNPGKAFGVELVIAYAVGLVVRKFVTRPIAGKFIDNPTRFGGLWY